jgi:hypothetical protein
LIFFTPTSRNEHSTESLSYSHFCARKLLGGSSSRQHDPVGWGSRKQTSHTQYENKSDEQPQGTSADDRPGRFPDLLSHGWTESRCHPQRQLCRTGDVSRNDQRQLRRHEEPLEWRTNNMTDEPTQADLDNHSDQLNPNNDEYWNSRGQGDDD